MYVEYLSIIRTLNEFLVFFALTFLALISVKKAVLNASSVIKVTLAMKRVLPHVIHVLKVNL
jgi:hypothetical protein